MKYRIDWIINGTIYTDADSEKEAEKEIENKLKNFINENNKYFSEMGATALQGTATSSNENGKT